MAPSVFGSKVREFGANVGAGESGTPKTRRSFVNALREERPKSARRCARRRERSERRAAVL
eukprot:6212512-Pleurochrysis_carterae.AAC.2